MMCLPSNGIFTLLLVTNIPTGAWKDFLGATLSDSSWYELKTRTCFPDLAIYSLIDTPASWIASGTLVEFEPTTQFCSIQQSPQSCLAATTSNFTCYWCQTVDKCSNGYDRYAAIWKDNVCYSNKEILANPTGKSGWYPHIVIPTIGLLVTVSIVCILALWIYRRKSN
ncbi:unnamed protein product, partial [Schistosoma turkestanicum]